MLRLEVQVLSLAHGMKYDFYNSQEYKKKQSVGTKVAWQKGIFNHRRAPWERRICVRRGCENSFEVKIYNTKKFCSRQCSALYNNALRGPLSQETRKKISASLRTLVNKGIHPHKGKVLVPRLIKNCISCGETFQTPRWQNHKYCSVRCSIRDIGSRRTSPKAARGKSGIRPDIHPAIRFYSRWEANFARILTLLKISWEFQPRAFDLGFQKYTPDFYLRDSHEYIEIKNFLSEYSKRRDEEFRKLFPNITLILILKKEYLELQEKFAPLIDNWEFS